MRYGCNRLSRTTTLSPVPLRPLVCAPASLSTVDIATVTLKGGRVAYTPLQEAESKKLLDALQEEAATGDA
jgi:hypothetical protein